MTVAPARSYDRSDWASAFVNVEQELTDVALSPVKGEVPAELVKEFFVAVVNNSGLTLHIRQLDGVNSHHIVEACFKAFARALRQATEIDPRRADAVPSSKGVLEQAGMN